MAEIAPAPAAGVHEKNGPSHDVEDLHTKANFAGADAALQYASAERIVIDEATNKRLLRLTDWHILPWLCALYFMQYLDKGWCRRSP